MSTQENEGLPAPKRPRGRPKKQVTITQTALPTAVAPVVTLPPKPRGKPKKQVTVTQTVQITTTQPDSPATPLTPFIPPTVTATTPKPPNWLENCEDTIISLLNFKKFPIYASSPEFHAIANFLHPIEITRIKQVVNINLWKRFEQTRKEMLRSKTDDLNILSKLDMDESELMRCQHFAMNFTKDSMLLPYSDNMVLLFHCTRSKSNLEKILSQGLDERLSNQSGLLGKGIYFADNPMKSLQYDGSGHILIFAVLLGDCVSVDHLPNKNLLVREPEKTELQKRNINDQFFDSIVARPNGFNEYVIYNRFQCCPIYQISYKRSALLNNNFNPATEQLPPIAWIPQVPNGCAMPVPVENSSHWPFFAVGLFEQMGAAPPIDETMMPLAPVDGNIGNFFDENLAKLIDLGFLDENVNRESLLRFNNDLTATLNYFLNLGNSIDVENQPPSTTTVNVPTTSSKESPESIVTIGNSSPLATTSNTFTTSLKEIPDTIDLTDDSYSA